jgi:phosphopantetheinyl transferase
VRPLEIDEEKMEMSSSLTIAGSRLETLAARPSMQPAAFKDARVHFISLAACVGRQGELRGLLSPTECEIARQINHYDRRTAYVASRALLREALSEYTDSAVTHSEWLFDTGPYGKPRVLIPAAPAPHFSISYTSDMLVIAVSQKFELGVDLEALPPETDREVPWQVLSSAERQAVHALPVAEQFLEFLRLWTLKEAYTKYFGLGAELDFRGVEVDLRKIRATAAAMPRDVSLDDPQLHQQLMTINDQLLVFAIAGGRPHN